MNFRIYTKGSSYKVKLTTGAHKHKTATTQFIRPWKAIEEKRPYCPIQKQLVDDKNINDQR